MRLIGFHIIMLLSICSSCNAPRDLVFHSKGGNEFWPSNDLLLKKDKTFQISYADGFKSSGTWILIHDSILSLNSYGKLANVTIIDSSVFGKLVFVYSTRKSRFVDSRLKIFTNNSIIYLQQKFNTGFWMIDNTIKLDSFQIITPCRDSSVVIKPRKTGNIYKVLLDFEENMCLSKERLIYYNLFWIKNGQLISTENNLYDYIPNKPSDTRILKKNN